MSTFFSSLRVRRSLGVVLVVALGCLLLAARPALAQGSLKETTSLGFVPADAATYSAALRTGQIWNNLANSQAFAALKQMPVYALLMEQAETPLAMLQGILQDPENKQLYDLLGEMVSEEIFAYGDASTTDLAQLAQEINLSSRFSRLFAQIEELQGGEASAETAQIKAVLETLNDNLDRIKVPATVIGFRIKSTDAAKAQLARLEAIGTAALGGNPALAGKLTRVPVAGSEFLTLALDGSLVPWDEIPLDMIEDEPGQYAKLIDKLKTLKLNVSLGTWRNYVLLSLGPNNDHLGTLGTGAVLADRPELAYLAKFADKPVTSISYLSQATAEKVNLKNSDLAEIAGSIETVIPDDLDENLKQKIKADVMELTQDISRNLPKPGAVLQVGYLTPQGIESYRYDWGQNPLLDPSQPLSLLDHVGGNPIAFMVNRQKYRPEDYELASKWLGKGYRYGVDIARGQLDGDDLDLFNKVVGVVEPLLARLDNATRTMLVPAMKDGQSGVVLDAGLSARKWHEMMPESAEPLPMIELALVFGVSDGNLLKQACAEYYAVASELLTKLHELAPDEVPEVKLPLPQTRDFPSGTVYYYSMPQEWGMDKRLAPNAGLSANVGVLSLAPQHTKRLLDTTPPPADGPLGMRDRPLASAGAFNFAGLVDAVHPWIKYGTRQALGAFAIAEGDDAADDTDMLKDILAQIDTGAKLARCFRGYSAVTYAESNVQVTFSRLHVEDLK